VDFKINFMNLEQEILSNPIKNYLYILGIILATYILKRFVSRFFASIIYTWVDKKNHSELRKSHVHRLVVPIEQFLLFLVAVIALYELKFPEVWNVHLFKLTLQEVIDSVVKLFFIILLIRVSLRTLEFISIILEERSKLTKDQTDDQLVLFFRDFFKVILYIIGVLLVLRYVFN
jgi:MscS family membrane protein